MCRSLSSSQRADSQKCWGRKATLASCPGPAPRSPPAPGLTHVRGPEPEAGTAERPAGLRAAGAWQPAARKERRDVRTPRWRPSLSGRLCWQPVRLPRPRTPARTTAGGAHKQCSECKAPRPDSFQSRQEETMGPERNVLGQTELRPRAVLSTWDNQERPLRGPWGGHLLPAPRRGRRAPASPQDRAPHAAVLTAARPQRLPGAGDNEACRKQVQHTPTPLPRAAASGT